MRRIRESIAPPGGLPRDPRPGSPLHRTLNHNLHVRRTRLARLQELADRVPREIADEQFAIRDLELRLGQDPTYPAPRPGDNP